jgi:hypothetical protein
MEQFSAIPDYIGNENALAKMFQGRNDAYLKEGEGIRNDFLAEAKMPEQLSGTRLAALTNQGKIDTFAQEETIRKQNLSREQQFNGLRSVLAMMDDPTIPDDDLVDYVVGASKMISGNDPGYNPNAKLSDAKRSAVWSHVQEAARQNPRGLRGMIERAMQSYAMDMPTQNKLTEEDNKGYNTQVNTLLNGMFDEARAYISASGSKDDLYKIAAQDMANIERAANNDVKAQAAANGLAITIDQAGNMKLPDSATPAQRNTFARIQKDVADKYAPRVRAAQAAYDQGLKNRGVVVPAMPAAAPTPAPAAVKPAGERKPLSSFGTGTK